MVRQIFEVEHEHNSVILWEGGEGCRIIYRTPEQAEKSAAWLTQISNRFHYNKEEIGVASIYVYGEMMSDYEFVTRFKSLSESAGLEIKRDINRTEKEFW